MDDDGSMLDFMDVFTVTVRYRQFSVDEVIAIDCAIPGDARSDLHIAEAAKNAYERVMRYSNDHDQMLHSASGRVGK